MPNTRCPMSCTVKEQNKIIIGSTTTFISCFFCGTHAELQTLHWTFMEQIEAYHSSNRHRNRVSWTVDQACRIFGKIPHRAVPCLQQEVKTSFVKAYFKFCKRSKSTKNAKHSFKPLKSNLWLREDLPLECKTFLLLLMEMTSSASLLKKSIHAERSVTIKRIVGVDCSILSLVCSPCIKIR